MGGMIPQMPGMVPRYYNMYSWPQMVGMIPQMAGMSTGMSQMSGMMPQMADMSSGTTRTLPQMPGMMSQMSGIMHGSPGTMSIAPLLIFVQGVRRPVKELAAEALVAQLICMN